MKVSVKQYYIQSAAISIALILACSNIYAQEQELTKIRQHYYKIQAQIEKQKSGELPEAFFQLTVNHSVAGTGQQKHETMFYFSAEPYKSGSTSYRLEKAEQSYNISARLNVYKEYVFTDKHLIFYYEKLQGEECGELRLYFSESVLADIKISVPKDCASYTKFYKAEDINKQKVQSVQSEAQRVLDTFSYAQRMILH